MKAFAAYAYIATIAIIWVFLLGRHYYLIHIKFNAYMLEHHEAEWKKMKQDLTGWYRMPSWTLYYTKAVYDFIWRSDENLGDQAIALLKKRIRRFLFELPLFFFIVVFVTLVLIWTSVLR